MTTDQMMAHEARMVGRPCHLEGHTKIEAGGQRIDFVVYRVEPGEAARELRLRQRRWATFVDGQPASSSIAATWW